MKLSVCVDMMFSYCDFYDRFGEVKNCGIDTTEFWKWTNKDIDKVIDSGMDISIFNIDSRDEQLSYDLSRGILNDGRVDDFLKLKKSKSPIFHSFMLLGCLAYCIAGMSIFKVLFHFFVNIFLMESLKQAR